jgi:uncharacterized protein YndB with AHSA1/START domain
MTAEARIIISASPEAVYDMVADVTRMGSWSPENVGAEWIDGATGAAPGARFKGRNKRKAGWSTTCTVVEAERGRAFCFDVGKGDTRWRYRFEPATAGLEVVESFEIVKVPNAVGRFMTRLGTGVSWSEREADLVRGMEVTLANLKAEAERASLS